MPSTFTNTINSLRKNSRNDIELGNSFEDLVRLFLENDAIQKEQFSKVWKYSDWAKKHNNYSPNDIGIDLIAKLRNEDDYCAIQCKCYQNDKSISKSDLDSFISASSSSDFPRLMLVDTSSQPLSKNAQSVFENLEKEFTRIQQTELENSLINWSNFISDGKISFNKKKEPLDHQIKAINAVKEGFSDGDRGKLIMACGTGKTFTSLCIAEELTGKSKKVLYMVPSLSLMSQTIREWKNDSKLPFNAFSACSDKKVGKKKSKDDLIEFDLNQLAFPATTDAEKLSQQVRKADASLMTVIFSTYHSIDVISNSQKNHNLDDFDLIICDEAHRTTGVTFTGDEDSNFVKIHSNKNIKGKKRLYMTATPKIYGEKAQKKEEEGEVTLFPMDKEEIFGKTFFYRSFGWAVENNLLSDYKVVVLNMNEQEVSNLIQNQFTEGSELNLDDATKMIGCYKALAKIGLEKDIDTSPITKNLPMQKALAFCQTIKISQFFTEQFSNVINEYNSNESVSSEFKSDLNVEIHHVDGSFNAEKRNEELRWLEEKTNPNNCRILSNAKCLSEGVDVPALDAVLFLHPRKSQIDVVQSVGRVMRKSEGKKIGYVIIPIAVAPGISANKALQDNDRYKVVWQILNALRTHDERLDSTINKIALGEDVSDKIEIIDGTAGYELDSTTAKIEDVHKRSKKKSGTNESTLAKENENTNQETQTQLSFTISELNQAIKAKIVEKCGTRDYWEKWADDIAKIAQAHITRIQSIVFNEGTPQNIAFYEFLEEIKDDLNPQITATDAVEMLAQHIVTRPVFDTLFKGNKFTSENAISRSIEKVLSSIYVYDFKGESKTLTKFYSSVRTRAKGIVTSNGRQKLIFELYERFFKNAFPMLTQRLGIIYTPIEIVDFIINSIEEILKDQFKLSLADEGVHILDPFTGTGTFIARLLQSNLIPSNKIKQKYENEIHANEIVLLACYIAGINIESTYTDIMKNEEYNPFQGLVLTDTFQLFEQDKDMIANLLPDNSQRRTKQKSKKISVILGNPPYSSKQTSANDNAANLKYTNLDKRIESTYAAETTATNKSSLYDSYIRAIRWASDRIGDNGVIGFVTNNGWIEGNSTSGLRKCLSQEFESIYIYSLRGNSRLTKELSKQEGGNVFDVRVGIAITLLVKNSKQTKECQIHFSEIEDYFDKNQKLSLLANYESFKNIIITNKSSIIKPDINNDWINQGDHAFNSFIPLGEKNKSNDSVIFTNYSRGLETSRDAWCYNSSKKRLITNIKKTIDFYNKNLSSNIPPIDLKAISWTRGLKKDFDKKVEKEFNEKNIYQATYRPFDNSKFVYFDRSLNEYVNQLPKFFPTNKHENLILCLSGIGSGEFSCLMTKNIPDLNIFQPSQCFPLYEYKKDIESENLIPGLNPIKSEKKCNISDECHTKFLSKYFPNQLSKKDIFFYVYGILHSKEYLNRFRNNLSKQLPRIPLVDSFELFRIISQSGSKLSEIHINFESVKEYPLTFKEGDLRLLYIENPKEFFKVEKMKFLKNNDKSSIIYNKNLTIENIPSDVYEYKVNGKSALEWIIDRQSIKVDIKTSIINNPNEYAIEVKNDPSYPLKLISKIITVSLETIEILKNLPPLNIN